ncbi:MAG: tRNA (adenosine(37)-N6)-threonylcarbamoyltransferase complex transferase subunit TsaD [bacterium]|nr:tRNA (adenosine(37)-N6)-threonylcarbamoyltransferase complex transferase subunit TsaD [bacterium]
MPKEPITILAIETSCDETGVAVVQQQAGKPPEVLASAVSSQVDIHTLTGGVVPEVAAREHASIISPMIFDVIRKSKVKCPHFATLNLRAQGPRKATSRRSLRAMAGTARGRQRSKIGIDAIAVTVGPGLMPALVIGVNAARTLAYAWGKLLVPVHHIEGHIYSALLSHASKIPNPKSQIPNKTQNPNFKPFPALALIVSGGHTLLVLVKDHLQYQVLGSTRDDAAGEAFDKVARLLGLPYPGGPAISELAKTGDPNIFKFTRPMLNSGDLDFSFSGLKTEVLYKVRDLEKKESLSQAVKTDIAAGFQQTVIDVLIGKTKQAIDQFQPRTLLLAGGVAANKILRCQMQSMADEHQTPLHIAPTELCGDNAIMIGQVACYAYTKKRTATWRAIDATARISIEDFTLSSSPALRL